MVGISYGPCGVVVYILLWNRHKWIRMRNGLYERVAHTHLFRMAKAALTQTIHKNASFFPFISITSEKKSCEHLATPLHLFASWYMWWNFTAQKNKIKSSTYDALNMFRLKLCEGYVVLCACDSFQKHCGMGLMLAIVQMCGWAAKKTHVMVKIKRAALRNA